MSGVNNSKDNNHRIEKILQFLQESPNDCFLLHALGLENIKIGNLLEARNLFEKVIQIDPHYVGTYYHLGKVYEHLSNKLKAIEVYEEGIKIARTKGDMHSMNELRSALDIVLEDEDE